LQVGWREREREGLVASGIGAHPVFAGKIELTDRRHDLAILVIDY
jgi:hypothetical protein